MNRQDRIRAMRWLSRPGNEDPFPIAVRPSRRGRVRWLSFAQALGLLLVAMGCARSKVQYEEIFRDETVHVRLAEKRDKSREVVTRGFDHPWDVEIGTLEDILESVLYKKGKVWIGSGRPEEAFPTFPRHALLKPLKAAFAQAGPDQAVDFSFVDARSILQVFRRMYLTDGIMFRKEGKLNIAFRNLAFEQMGGEEFYDEPARGDPTESPMRTSWVLLERDGQVLVKASDPGLLEPKTFTNWMQLDLSRPWGVSDRQVIEKAMPGTGEALEPVVDSEYDLPEPGDASREEVQQRLEFLEELRREGTISEESYRDKKQELMRLYESLPE